MSTFAPSVSTGEVKNADRQHLWLAAGLAPIVLGPIWFALPLSCLGSWHSFAGLVLVLVLVCTSFTDLKSRKIYNWASYTAAIWGFVICLLPLPFSAGSVGLTQCLAGFLICFGLMLIPYALARGGAGDVKLAAAIGSLVGVGDGLLIVAFTYIIAAISILCWTILKKGPLNLFNALFRKFAGRYLPQYFHSPSEEQRLLLEQPIPLAGFFTAASVIVVFDVPLLMRSVV
jgi:Flp pilus assembly protein protease CpaA